MPTQIYSYARGNSKKISYKKTLSMIRQEEREQGRMTQRARQNWIEQNKKCYAQDISFT